MDKKNKIIMGWSAKAGCTISVKMFFEHMGILDEALAFSPWVHNYRMSIFYNKFGIPQEEFQDKQYFKFKVVRNPYHRAVSSFVHYLQMSKLNLSFVDFIEIIKKDNIPNGGGDIHWKKQTDKFNYDRIVKLENLESEIKSINSLLNTNFSPHHTSPHHHDKESTFNFVGKNKFTMFDKIIPEYDEFYNDEIRDSIRNLYRQDFLTFGYDF